MESWTTGEQLGSWLLHYRCGSILKPVQFLFFLRIARIFTALLCVNRGLSEAVQGWSVSLLTDDGWTDLAGSDFVMDLLAGAEAGAVPPPGIPSTPASDYLFSSHGDR